ncbi:cell wall hydrolase [Aurantiacibacter sediminis]|uniref:Cell wall hydrolase n=1 Tax=Aurantiacibacter sediminis TaxID=2793064 RepID=A0ABS0N2T7_9SPHN|nr:cell wall hydrolase [Aurantiacibacter sediminis]MBH5322233.1 cell wall hydrolase [Aurantiacibacter sediminis]
MSPAFPAQPRRDFRTKRVPAKVRAKSFAKKLGVLAFAVAVPTLAAPATLEALQSEPEEPQVELMPFETPGESFPGSAFYYLEQSPELVEMAGFAGPVEIIGDTAFVRADDGNTMPLAAPVLRIAGSDRDHVRAQQCMTQAIYYEAASESESGQRAVAQVVLNRVAHPAYPRSVCGVVYQGSERRTGCQFTFTCDGSLARQPSQSGWNRASRIAREALSGVVYARVGTATHYHTLAVSPYWAPSLETIGIIGAHIFYRWPGRAGQPDAFSARYAGAEPAPGRARAVTQDAPDPVNPGSIEQFAATPAPNTAPVAPAEAPQPAASAPAGEAQEGSGSVRPEFRNSGRWIERP